MTSLWDGDCSSIPDCATVCGSATPPTNPVSNQLWFNTGTQQWNMFSVASTWVPVGGGGGSGFPPPIKQGQILSGEGAPLAWIAKDAFIEGNF